MVTKNNITFPQANDVNKLIKLIYFKEEDLKSNNLIETSLQVSLRQVNYYLSALTYLDIVEKRKFTSFGRKLKKMPKDIFIKNLIKRILSEDVFFDVFYEMYFLKRNIKADEIGSLIYIADLVDGESVAIRRASTVKSWVSWIINQIQ